MIFEKFLSGIINFFVSLSCPTWGCTQEDLDEMMIKKGYRRGYGGVWIMPDDIILDEEYRA